MKNYKILIIGLFIILATFVAAYTGFILRQNHLPSSIGVWNQWDTFHYTYLAERGYCNMDCFISAERFSIAFFPLYPFLIKIFNFVVGDYVLSALVISNICYLLVLYVLYGLVKKDFPDDVAFKTIILLSAFPTAYFLHAGYTESLFILLSVASFYFARSEKWPEASVLGGLACLARINGIFLFPALLVEYLMAKKFSLKAIKADIGYLCIIPLGSIYYLFLNYQLFGNVFQFMIFQKEHWYKYITWPVQGFLGAFHGAFDAPMGTMSVISMMELFSALFIFILLVVYIKKIRPSYSVYAFLNLFIVTFCSVWMSIPRFALAIFPIFIILALLSKRSYVFYPLLFLFLMLQSIFLMQFITVGWAF